ncbi:hypothetical protein HPB49_013215 [Dermacentor silvarum]|uniref:Uncharacterized protein n=1 Tax=Dermacentor silvarum TaxID=543639 RepID=A0ACB8CRM3_DERSI|nr:hypothetical protein HPB49_013215 [Dermacentor silvarum]
MDGIIDTGSSGCLLRASAAAWCGMEIVQECAPFYGFGSKHVPVTRSIGHCRAKINIDGADARSIRVIVVPDDAQSFDMLESRTLTELPYVTYAKDESPFAIEPQESVPEVTKYKAVASEEGIVKADEATALKEEAAQCSESVEKIKADEEAERLREEKLKHEQARKERKQKETEWRERAKAEGPLFTKAQKIV